MESQKGPQLLIKTYLRCSTLLPVFRKIPEILLVFFLQGVFLRRTFFANTRKDIYCNTVSGSENERFRVPKTVYLPS